MLTLEKAWEWRVQLKAFENSDALRVFHGPGEGDGDLSCFAVDRFGDHYWVTQWEGRVPLSQDRLTHAYSTIVNFLKLKGAASIVGLSRPEKGLPSTAIRLFSSQAQSSAQLSEHSARIQVMEAGSKFWIQLEKTRHPGLFLDHFPLRQWLKKHSLNRRVLNAFAYTGSLSVAAGLGGAKRVITLDLSQPSIEWAKENWKLNDLPESKARFIVGDVFEWLPRLKRQNEEVDCIILDPPSFSHGKTGSFSTAKDLHQLHDLALALLPVEGLLITSINSANVSLEKYEGDILAAAKNRKIKLNVIRTLQLPETYPTVLGQPSDRYLKGWILRREF